MTEWKQKTIAEHTLALERGEYSSLELTHAYLARIREQEPLVHAFLLVDEEGALRLATESDERRREGKLRSPLDGIPFAVKDNFCTAGLRTSCASRLLEAFVPTYDAAVVERLKQAGAIPLGKLNMDEFAMGSANEYSAFGAASNPCATDHVPGGSSGGSAAAVAAGEVPFSLGSDTGGSIRQPAAFCGVVGLKPTYGAVSRYGLVEFASSLDCVGLVTHTAADCATLFSVLLGRDERDGSSVAFAGSREDSFGTPLRVAVVKEFLESDAVSPAVKRATEDAVRALTAMGAQIQTVSLPSPQQALATYCVLSAVEASSNLARFDGIRYGASVGETETLSALYSQNRGGYLGREVIARILFGTCLLSRGNRERYLVRAEHFRSQIRRALLDILASCDLILTPTAPTTAYRKGAKLTPLQRREADLCAVYANLAGLPALSLPMGRDEEGLPVGIQLMGAPFSEFSLLKVAQCLEERRSL
ncbi:MAG: Asp-tRNA(Asn)/Glu-tRNA(Gln) amidotransferase subunit GatA [Clostridia bacterium]|nr:Asp-tRNA(Asn)/Glu-tRNA(Gln) amidotransferase subunit GatA [Clostridia bacterium]